MVQKNEDLYIKYIQNSFSVLIPYYNEAGYLEDTIKTWINQTRKPDKIIHLKETTHGSIMHRCDNDIRYPALRRAEDDIYLQDSYDTGLFTRDSH